MRAQRLVESNQAKNIFIYIQTCQTNTIAWLFVTRQGAEVDLITTLMLAANESEYKTIRVSQLPLLVFALLLLPPLLTVLNKFPSQLLTILAVNIQVNSEWNTMEAIKLN